MKRYLKPALILGASMLLFSHVEIASADDYDDNELEDVTPVEEKTEQLNESTSSNTNSSSSVNRGIEFETIYDPDKKAEVETSQEESPEKEGGSNVLEPAEPEDDIDGIVNNDDDPEDVAETPDETEETEIPEEAPNEEAPNEEAPNEEAPNEEAPNEEDNGSEEDSDSNEEVSDSEEENEDEPVGEAPVLDERGKITNDGLNRLDDRVNRVMSEKITKSDKPSQSNDRTEPDKEENDEYIIERMQKFLSQQSAFATQDKTFVHKLVVDKIIVKYMRPVRLPL